MAAELTNLRLSFFLPMLDEAELEERLSRPTPGSVRAMRELSGDLLILGASGKMGPSLAIMARRSAQAAGRGTMRIIGVARYSTPGSREQLEAAGVEAISCDLLDEDARRKLPDCPNVLMMLGYKFSKDALPGLHWAMNTYLPGLLAEQYRRSRIVCFSSGNVYPFTPFEAPQPTERTPCGPVGEYAMTAFGRERMLQYASARHGTPVCLLRLNYAVEARYGVLVDLAEQIVAGKAIDLATPYVNFVWQGYADSVALEAFALANSPADILNLTGPRERVRDLVVGLAERLGVEPKFAGEEGPTALLNDASRCWKQFGEPELGREALLDMTADWFRQGNRRLDKPTKFQVRDGKF
jgi:nucleoside-diphosphate-sugar epimerase